MGDGGQGARTGEHAFRPGGPPPERPAECRGTIPSDVRHLHKTLHPSQTAVPRTLKALGQTVGQALSQRHDQTMHWLVPGLLLPLRWRMFRYRRMFWIKVPIGRQLLVVDHTHNPEESRTSSQQQNQIAEYRMHLKQAPLCHCGNICRGSGGVASPPTLSSASTASAPPTPCPPTILQLTPLQPPITAVAAAFKNSP